MTKLNDVLFNRYINTKRCNADIHIIADEIEYLINKYNHAVDKGFDKKIITLNNDFERQTDHLVELAFSKNLSEEHKLKIHSKGNKGLDIYIEDIKGWGEYKCADYAKDKNGNIIDIKSQEELLLRITNAIQKKIIKVNKDYGAGLIQNNQPVILFISLDKLSKVNYLLNNYISGLHPPSILRSCFPLGEPKISIGLTTKKIRNSQQFEYSITKNNGSKVYHDYFTKDTIIENNVNYSTKLISAIIFAEDISNTLYDKILFKNKYKSNYIMVHNPLAINKIKEKLIKCQYEFSASITNIKSGQILTLTELQYPNN